MWEGGGSGVERDGDFIAFYRRDRDRLCRTVTVTVGDASLAVEAVDEAFVRAYERWDQVRGCRQPAAWVYRVAVNWATSWRRKWSRRPTRPVEELDRAHDDRALDTDVLARLRGLPAAHRETLVLRFVFDLSVVDTAEALGVSPGTVKSRVSRALRMLARQPEVLR